MFRLIKKRFIELLISIVNASNHAKCKQSEMYESTYSYYLHPYKYGQEFHYYPFSVKLDKCVGNCNTLNYLFDKVCIPNKKEYLKLSVFNMITGINESKALTKHISCKCRCKFDGKKFKPNQCRIPINVDVSVKNALYVKKIMFGILLCVVVKIKNIEQSLWTIQQIHVMKL